MAPAKAWLLVLVLLVTSLAGCLGGAKDPTGASQGMDTAEAGPADPTRPAATEPLGPESVVEAPDWQIGQTWDWHLEDGDFTADWTLVVAEETPQAFVVAPTDQDPARRDAIFDWYVFGPMSKDRLTDEDAGGLVFYEFPLEDGKTWESVFAPGFLDWQVTHTAWFAPAIETSEGTFPGFQVEATVNGSTFFTYDYVPEIGWFSSLTNHELPEEGGDGSVDWRYTTTGWGQNWTGTYHQASAEMLLDAFHEVDANPERAEASPMPHASFTVAEDADALFGVAMAASVAGASQTTLVTPEHDTHQLTAISSSTDGAATFMAHFLDAVPGTWEVTMGGAGVDSEGLVQTWQVHDEPGEVS